MRLFIGLTFRFVLAAPAFAYEGVEVPNGGEVAVLVLHAGEPRQVTAEVTRDEEHCGTQVVTPVVETGPGGGLLNAVVSIADIAQGKAPDSARARLDNRGCRFLPRVQSMTTGQTLEISNSDPILHNTHATIGGRTVFNLALPLENQRISKKITAPGAMHVTCDAGHTWMEAWIHAFPHPYHAVTGGDGRARIAGVPPGTYRVTAWHEALGTQTLKVAVEAGKTAEFRFTLLRTQ